MRLSTRAYWDQMYGRQAEFGLGRAPGRKRSPGSLSPILTDLTTSYDQYLLWEEIYPRYMPKGGRLKVVEIGSAPGRYLVKLSKRHGLEPYGIEYSAPGAALNRKLFSSNGIDPENVILGDFFSTGIQRRYQSYFDIVVSRGFIEHFSEVDRVLRMHVNLLKPGGLLFVTIPNYRGINFLLQSFFDRRRLDIHNLKIMERHAYARLFADKNLEELYCDYWGTFNFGLFCTDSRRISRQMMGVCEKTQRFLNLVFRLLFKKREYRNRSISPHLIYIGRSSIPLSGNKDQK